MKKYLSISLSLLLILSTNRCRADGDIEGFAELVGGGVLLAGVGALVATIAGIVGAKKAIARLKAKKLGVSLEVYTAANMYRLDLKEYRKILQMAEKKDLDGLRKEFTQRNREVFGPDWVQTRDQQFRDFFSMSGREYANKYSRAQYDAALNLWKVYEAVYALYFGIVKAFFATSIWHRMVYKLAGRLLWKEIQKLDGLLFEKHLPDVPPLKQTVVSEVPSIPIY